jgi:hypothetical protein
VCTDKKAKENFSHIRDKNIKRGQVAKSYMNDASLRMHNIHGYDPQRV